MTRIGRQIPHFEWIDLQARNAIFSKDRRYRYLLTMQYRDSLLDSRRDKSLAVILKNPSAADESYADATIRKVETFVHRHFSDVRHLHILNIFGLRATDAIELNTVLENEGPMAVIGPENDRIISETISSCDYIIVAWGNHSGIEKSFYEERVNQVKRLLVERPGHIFFHVEGKKSTHHPLHGLMWGYHYEVRPAYQIFE